MDSFFDFLTNYYLVSAICAWLLAQFIKILTGIFRMRKFSVQAMLFGSGGMPSSHTAAVTALCTACGVRDGLGSASFAITAVLCIIVMMDATGVRRETGKQSRALNIIVAELFSGRQTKKSDEQFKELIGHTPLQVFFGCVTGIAVALLLHLIPVFA